MEELEELNEKLAKISDKDLAEQVSNLISKLCRSGSSAFIMSVPVNVSDSDMILCELVRRFKELTVEK